LLEEFRGLSAKQPDPADRLIADRMIGTVLHYMGDQTNARRHIERMLRRYVDPRHRSDTIRFVWDQRVAGDIVLAVILWLQGFPDQAMRTARSTIEGARASDHTISLCYALTRAACLVALWVGDLSAAQHYVAMLLDHSAQLAMEVWQAWGRCFEGVLLIKRGNAETGLRLLRTALDELRETGSALRYTAFLGALAEVLAEAGRVAEGLAAVDEALERSERNEERWCIAELLRINSSGYKSGPTPTTSAEWDEIVDLAVDSGDEHAIKLTEACRRLEALHPSPVFQAAADDWVHRVVDSHDWSPQELVQAGIRVRLRDT
jgi:hypothetical protein